MQNIFQELSSRGYVYQATDLENISLLLNSNKQIIFYLGIDPTAESLHIGHFVSLMMFRKLQDAGHKGILVIGGATALVGDPTWKRDARGLLSKQQVKNNLEEIKKLAGRFINLENNSALILNNSDWFSSYNYIDFMRDIGAHFNINTMLQADTYANRINNGLTFLEMGYMLMQAYDFIYLNQNYNCVLQIGGADQWGNIIAGINLYRKLNLNKNIFGLTCPLLLNSDGKKMGKTEQGTLWIARDRTTPYDFYQYFYNTDDSMTETLLKLFTDISLEKIKDMCEKNILDAKKIMSYEITSLVHGKQEADLVLNTVTSLFKNNLNHDNMPTVKIKNLKANILLVDLIHEANFLPSKSEARRLITQNAISLDGVKILDINKILTQEDFAKGYVILKSGKKKFLKIIKSN